MNKLFISQNRRGGIGDVYFRVTPTYLDTSAMKLDIEFFTDSSCSTPVTWRQRGACTYKLVLKWDISPDNLNIIYFTPLVGTTLIQVEYPINGETWKLNESTATIYSLELYSGTPLLNLIGYKWDPRYRYKIYINSSIAYTASHTLELRSNSGLVWFSFSGIALRVGNNGFTLYSQYKSSDPFSFAGRFSVILNQLEVDYWNSTISLTDKTYSTITLPPKVQTYTLNLYNDFDSTIYVWDSPTVVGQPTYDIPAKTNKVPITAKGGITIHWPSNSTSYTAAIKGPNGVTYWSQYIHASGEQKAITDKSLLENLESMMSAGVYATLTNQYKIITFND